MVVLDRKNPEAAIPQLETKIDSISKALIDRVYPVGSCYFTSEEGFDPAIIVGKWERETNTSPFRWRRIR